MTIRNANSMKNSKIIGNNFEQDLCEYLYKQGYWVHFLTPAANGSQPFDILAVKDNQALAIDCKTLEKKSFPFNRIEDNQESAFTLMNERGNWNTYFCIKISDTEIVFAPSYDLIEKYHKGEKSISVEDLINIYGTHNFK